MQSQIQGFRLSSQQQHIWKLQQETAAPYQAVCTIDWSGLLDREMLQAALQHCVQRHEILRTSYKRKPGIIFPLQIVANACAVALELIDLSGEQAHEQERKNEQLCHEQGEVEDVYPLSSQQQMMLQYSNRMPGSGIYIIHVNYTMTVTTQVDASPSNA